MEKPYTGRTVINDLYNGAEVIILPFRPAIIWLHTVVYLGFFSLFSYFLFFDNTSAEGSNNHAFYIVIAMYCMITFALISTAYTIWWTVKGKEVVTIAGGTLTIDKVNSIEKAKSYNLGLATNFRAEEEVVRYGRNFGRIEGYAWQVAVKGTVKFDYDVVDIIKFGDWLSEAEGEYILTRLRAKKLIS